MFNQQTPNQIVSMAESKAILIGILMLILFVILIVFGQALILVGLLIGIPFLFLLFKYPRLSLVSILGGRILIDLTYHWNLGIGPLNHLSIFTVACIFYSTFFIIKHIHKAQKNPLFIPFLIFSCLLLISMPRALSFIYGLELTLKTISPFVILLFIYTQLKSKEDVFRVLIIISTFAVIPILISLYYLMTGQMNEVILADYNRLLGGYINLRTHALSMFLFWGVYTILILSPQLKKWRIVYFILAALTLIFIYLTHMRSAQLIVVGSVFAFMIITRRHTLLILSGIILLVSLYFSTVLQDRFDDLILIFNVDELSYTDIQQLGSGRFIMWTRALPLYFEQDIYSITFGLGSGKHVTLAQRVYDTFSTISGDSEVQYFIDTHNNILWLLFQFGPFSLVLFAYMLFKTLKMSTWLLHNSTETWIRSFGSVSFALTIGFIMNDSISNGFINRPSLSIIFWALMAAGFSLQSILKKEKSEALIVKKTDPSGSDTIKAPHAFPV